MVPLSLWLTFVTCQLSLPWTTLDKIMPFMFIAYADDISAVIIADTEAEIQLAVDVLLEEFWLVISILPVWP